VNNFFVYNINQSKSVFYRFIQKCKLTWNKIPLIDRWLLGELITPLLFSIAAFTVVSLSIGVMFDLVRRIVEVGLPLGIALKVLFLKMPGFIVISFPMSMLMATLLAYSRLSENSEIKALRSIGISVPRTILPAIILAFFMTSLTFLFNNNIVPFSNRNAEITLNSSLGKVLRTEVGSNLNTDAEASDITFFRKGQIKDFSGKTTKKGLTHLFYAWRFDNNEMADVTVLDFSKDDFKQILLAEKGKFNSIEGFWEFTNGSLLTLSSKGETVTTKFERYIYPFGNEPLQLAKLPKDANDMSVSEAIQAEKLYRESGDAKESRRMQVRIQEKFTLPCACIVFALIGSCLGSKPNTRSSRSQGFGLSIVLILVYYVISFSFSSLGVKGTIQPFFAAWGPVFISIIGGSFLLKRTSK
tara:strand:- start:784 stop:2022 length:1239 start_codon:yes stop_codon:yes gene_type:complete